jgi:hypothetical protein
MSKQKLTPEEEAAYKALARAAQRLRAAQERAGRTTVRRQRKQREAAPCK